MQAYSNRTVTIWLNAVKQATELTSILKEVGIQAIKSCETSYWLLYQMVLQHSSVENSYTLAFRNSDQ